MTEYRTSTGSSGITYAVRVGDEWKPITEDEAKAVGVWRDARRSTIGVRDDLAAPEQLAARDKGLYDPRGPSGNRIAKRLSLRCGRCDAELATRMFDIP